MILIQLTIEESAKRSNQFSYTISSIYSLDSTFFTHLVCPSNVYTLIVTPMVAASLERGLLRSVTPWKNGCTFTDAHISQESAAKLALNVNELML